MDKTQGGPWKAFRLNVTVDDYDQANEGAQLWWMPDWRTDEACPGSGTFQRK